MKRMMLNMMKRSGLVLLMLLVSVTLVSPVSAHGDHSADLDDVVSALLESYGIESVGQLKCKMVTDEQFEAVGEAVMSKAHPDTEVHEMMDQMMGGEGSASLREAHISMGAGYLGCHDVGGGPGGWGGMMGGGMMGGGWGSNFGQGMMGGRWLGLWSWGGPLLMVVFWGVVLAGGLLLVNQLVSGRGKNARPETALDILKKRFAKGEISRKEYQDLAAQITR